MTTVGVMGCGVVGEACAKGFESKGVTVRRYDKFKPGIDDVTVLGDCDIVFLCIPTPTDATGQQDQRALVDAFSNLFKLGFGGTIVVKSTVLPGSTSFMARDFIFRKVVHNPEFLTAARPLEDFMNQPVILLGGNDHESLFQVGEFYKDVFQDVPIRLFMAPEYTETIKYARNNYLATKVGFFNDQHDICKKIGIDYNKMLDGLLSVGGIESTHTMVPGPDGGFGFSGMCFPKDTQAQLSWGKDLGLSLEQLEATVKANKRRRP